MFQFIYTTWHIFVDFFSNLSEPILIALISAVVTAMMAFFKWLGKLINKCCIKKKQFTIYKNYAIEFLTVCITAYNDKEFKFFNKNYKLDELEIKLIKNPNNIDINLFSTPKAKLIPMYAIGFISKKYMLSYHNLWLLRAVLDNLSSDDIWFFLDHTLLQYHGTDNLIHTAPFNVFSIEDKNNNILFLGTNDCNIVLATNITKDKLKTLRDDLKNSKFDKRIKKAIKQWEMNNLNHIT